MYKVKVGEKEFEVNPKNGNALEGIINQEAYVLDAVEEKNGLHFLYNEKSFSVSIVEADYDAKSITLMVNGSNYTLEAKDRFDLLLKELGMENLNANTVNELKAPMPGLVLSVNVSVGDVVSKGAPLLVLEAMKMENILKAPSDVTIKNITAETGKAVEKNQVLIEFGD